MSSGIWFKWFCQHLQTTPSTTQPAPCCTPVYFTPTTKSDILHLTDSILHCCTNFTFYRFNSRQSWFPPAAPFPVEIPRDSWGRFKFPPFYIQLRSLKAKGMQGVNLVDCCQTPELKLSRSGSGGGMCRYGCCLLNWDYLGSNIFTNQAAAVVRPLQCVQFQKLYF